MGTSKEQEETARPANIEMHQLLHASLRAKPPHPMRERTKNSRFYVRNEASESVRDGDYGSCTVSPHKFATPSAVARPFETTPLVHSLR